MRSRHILTIAAACGAVLPLAHAKKAKKGLRASHDQEILPIWKAEWEHVTETNDLSLILPNRAVALPENVHLPAEFERSVAVVMTWAYWTAEVIHDIAKHVAAEGVEVWLVGGPKKLSGVPQHLYAPLNVPYNSVWARDYGPVGIDNLRLAVVDTRYRHYKYRISDDAIPCRLADHAGAKCYTTTLTLDGGNVMTDGQGNLFMTTRTYAWNPSLSTAEVDELLKTYFGVHTIHALDYAQVKGTGVPADGTGHIDMFAKIMDRCVVMVAESRKKPFEKPLEAAADYFSSLDCDVNFPSMKYRVLRTPGWVQDGAWYTYTNSLLVGKSVIVPSYTNGLDKTAESIYKAARPDLSVKFVNTDQTIRYGGSVHCLTRQIPDVMVA